MMIGAKTSQPLKNAAHQGILLIEFRQTLCEMTSHSLNSKPLM